MHKLEMKIKNTFEQSANRRTPVSAYVPQSKQLLAIHLSGQTILRLIVSLFYNANGKYDKPMSSLYLLMNNGDPLFIPM